MIEIHPIEPNRLKLIWQSTGTDRSKYVVGEIVRSSLGTSLSYLYYNKDFIASRIAGFTGHTAFPFHKPVYHENVIETFARRLPARSRNDFLLYLSNNRLASNAMVSDMALLGYTGAYLPSDGFSFAVDWRFQEPPFIFLMEVSGFRYHSGMNMQLNDIVQQHVSFVREPNNQFDPHAISIFVHGTQIGYVPRYYAEEFGYWLAYYNVTGFIERIDGSLSKPRIFIAMIVSPNTQQPRVSSSFAM